MSTASDATSWWTQRWGVSDAAGPDGAWPVPNVDNAWVAKDEHVSPDDPLLTSLEEEFQQIRSKDRVRDLAEVFTHQREIDAMLDMIPDAFEYLDIKFLEPACGSRNFLVEIRRRKLGHVSRRDTISREQYQHRTCGCFGSISAIDISAEDLNQETRGEQQRQTETAARASSHHGRPQGDQVCRQRATTVVQVGVSTPAITTRRES